MSSQEKRVSDAWDRQHVAISRDGRWVAYSTVEWPDTDKIGLYVVSADGSDRYMIAQSGTPSLFTFTPDGEYIVYLSSGTLTISSPDGRERCVLDENVASFAVTPRDRQVVYSKISSAVSERPDGESAEQHVSHIFRIGFDGQDRTLVLDAQEGFVELLQVFQSR